MGTDDQPPQRKRVSVLPAESDKTATAYCFAEIFAEELKLVYASRQLRKKSRSSEPRYWSDDLLNVARGIVNRKLSTTAAAKDEGKSKSASA